MEKTGRLQLELMDVYGQRLEERVDIILRHMEFSDVIALRNQSVRNRILISKLHGTPRGNYRLLMDPPSYLPVASVVNVEASGITSRVFVFPIDPEKVIRVEFPAWGDIPFAQDLLRRSDQVLGFAGKAGEALYGALDDIRRAGLLNILAKSQRTVLTGGRRVLEYLGSIREIRGDRFFAAVPKALREDVKNSIPAGLFSEVNGALHRPPEGYSPAGSFKTPDSFGNLQLTFFAKGPDDWVADIDIDDANGLAHAFQVLRNHITGRPTHPFDIHQILIRTQELDPGYKLIVHEPSGTARGASAGGKG